MVVERSKVSGNFARPAAKVIEPKMNPDDFKPDAPEKIKEGMIIMHLRFGEGKVMAIEGGKDNAIASIQFKETGETKKIALKFAKLQILG